MNLDIYVPRRPRRYADRQWLEGYCNVAASIHNIVPTVRGTQTPFYAIQTFRKALANPTFKPTAKLKGSIDAWLDALGC